MVIQHKSMLNFLKYFIIFTITILELSYADTRIIDDDFTITIDNLVGGDSILVTKEISVEHDENDTNITCGIKVGASFLDASTGQTITFSDSSQSIDLSVTFPSSCQDVSDGTNELRIEGTLPTNVDNDASLTSEFALSVRFISPS